MFYHTHYSTNITLKMFVPLSLISSLKSLFSYFKFYTKRLKQPCFISVILVTLKYVAYYRMIEEWHIPTCIWHP